MDIQSLLKDMTHLFIWQKRLSMMLQFKRLFQEDGLSTDSQFVSIYFQVYLGWPMISFRDTVVQYFPEWLPGMSFKKTGKEWRKILMEFYDKPYAFVQRRLVSYPVDDLKFVLLEYETTKTGSRQC